MLRSNLIKGLALCALAAGTAQAAAPSVFMTGAAIGPAPNYALLTREGGNVSGFAPASTFLEYCNVCYGQGQATLNYGPGFFIQWGVAYPYAIVGHAGVQFQGPAATGYKYTIDAPIANVVVDVGDWAATAGPRTFTVALTNAAYAQYADPTTTAKTVCSADVTEPVHAQNASATDSNGVNGTASGLVTFTIPAASFKCNHGKLNDMNAITVAAVFEDLAKMPLDANGYPAGGNAFGIVVGGIRLE